MSEIKEVKEIVKIDAGKPPLSWLPRQPLLAVAEVMRRNQEPIGKYQRHSARKGGKWSQIIDAALRHLLAFQERLDMDEEDGALHIDHALCNLLFLSDWQHRGVGEDDRVKLEETPKSAALVTETSSASRAYADDLVKCPSCRYELLAVDEPPCSGCRAGTKYQPKVSE